MVDKKTDLHACRCLGLSPRTPWVSLGLILGPLVSLSNGGQSPSVSSVMEVLQKRQARLQKVWGRFDISWHGRDLLTKVAKGMSPTTSWEQALERRRILWGRDELRVRVTQEYEERSPPGDGSLKELREATRVFDGEQTTWCDPLQLQAFFRKGYRIPKGPGSWSLLTVLGPEDLAITLRSCAGKGLLRVCPAEPLCKVEFEVRSRAFELYVDMAIGVPKKLVSYAVGHRSKAWSVTTCSDFRPQSDGVLWPMETTWGSYREDFANGLRPMCRVVSLAEEVHVNEPFPEGFFDVRFPPHTLVADLPARLQYFVGGGDLAAQQKALQMRQQAARGKSSAEVALPPAFDVPVVEAATETENTDSDATSDAVRESFSRRWVIAACGVVLLVPLVAAALRMSKRPR